MHQPVGLPPLGRAGEFVLSDPQFERIRALVREHTGIALSPAKRPLVYGRLVRRLRALRLPGFADYIELLEQADPAELEEFTNAITTNMTSFFRESHHFDYLAGHALPAIAARAPHDSPGGRRLRIWSCACSTGEEPYSIAIVLREHGSLLRGIDARILATDLDSSALATGAAGIYPAARLQGVSPARARSCFRAGTGSRQGQIRIDSGLRALITFRRLNLMDPWPMRGPFDVIFCRNVIIYFDKATQRVLFDRMAALQRPGDLLFLGHSESLHGVSERYQPVGPTMYRRVEG